MLSNEIKRLKMEKIKFENLGKKILKLDTYRRITQIFELFKYMMSSQLTNENTSSLALYNTNNSIDLRPCTFDMKMLNAIQNEFAFVLKMPRCIG